MQSTRKTKQDIMQSQPPFLPQENFVTTRIREQQITKHEITPLIACNITLILNENQTFYDVF